MAMTRIAKHLMAPALGSILGLAPMVRGLAQEAPETTAAHPTGKAVTSTRVLDTRSLYGLERLIGQLANKRVVLLGERHDRYEDHLTQLALIRGLYARNPNLAIGMEFFQQPFQGVLDGYIAGELTEEEMLARSEYFERWRFDYRLYQPILHFAREKGIPLVALNLPQEITRRVGDQGISGLSDTQRVQIPQDIDRSDEAYRERVRGVFAQHPKAPGSDFERFLEVQLLWDEGMAERAARYLQQNPGKRLVVLAGSGHLVYGQGIPKRLKRRLPVSLAVVLNSCTQGTDPAVADYLLFPEPQELPPAGALGILLDIETDRVRAQGFAEQSGAEAAGIKAGDQILSIADRPIQSYTDVRIALLGRAAGERVPVVVRRDRLLLGPEEIRVEVELH